MNSIKKMFRSVWRTFITLAVLLILSVTAIFILLIQAINPG